MPSSPETTTVKPYNPKSHAPAVYIPCWLLQISSKELSYLAKIVYGRLAQCGNSSGNVYRSIPQLSAELVCSKSSINRAVKELKNARLIQIHHKQNGTLFYSYVIYKE